MSLAIEPPAAVVHWVAYDAYDIGAMQGKRGFM